MVGLGERQCQRTILNNFNGRDFTVTICLFMYRK
jgi:hypothetical protein